MRPPSPRHARRRQLPVATDAAIALATAATAATAAAAATAATAATAQTVKIKKSTAPWYIFFTRFFCGGIEINLAANCPRIVYS